MPHYKLAYEARPALGEGTMEFDVPSLHIALVVAGINAGDGPAEIRDGNRVVARLRRQGSGASTFWQVG